MIQRYCVYRDVRNADGTYTEVLIRSFKTHERACRFTMTLPPIECTRHGREYDVCPVTIRDIKAPRRSYMNGLAMKTPRRYELVPTVGELGYW